MAQELTEKDLSDIEELLGYTFRNRALLRQAFTRSSYVNERAQSDTPSDTPSNEVLEFLGDSVLSTALIVLLLETYGKVGGTGLVTTLEEGEFSTLKSRMSDKSALSSIIRDMGVGHLMRMSYGDIGQDILREDSPNEDLFESIVGAVALDSHMDFSAVRALIARFDGLDRLLSDGTRKFDKDPKSRIKEYCERHHLSWNYVTVSKTGPEHAPLFRRALYIDGELYGEGEGQNTKKADRAAAAAAWQVIEGTRG